MEAMTEAEKAAIAADENNVLTASLRQRDAALYLTGKHWGMIFVGRFVQ